MFRKLTSRSILAIVSGLLAVLVLVAPVSGQSTWEPRSITASIKGSGATFPNPIYQTWISVYKKVNPSVTLSYQAVGSGQGQNDFVRYLTDFGGTDSVVADTRIKAEAPDTLHVPMLLGGVVPTYHVEGVSVQLRFSPEVLSGIYLGQIKKWNDPKILADNPGVSLPSTKITPVYRSDSSGTSSIWTDYLSKVSADWKARVGSGTTVKWPAGVGAPGNAGIASTVLRTNGAIGYVEQAFAAGNKLPVPLVKNSAGNFVAPTTENVSAAAAGITIPDDLRFSLTNASGANSYPIVGATWILVRQQTYTDASKAQALTDFIYWGLTDGQGATSRLGYAPLPEAMRKKSIEQLRKVTVNGQRVFDGPVK